ncbi:hypothetical protein PsYK624_158930 [Phanerochaete sordida]|uniref:Uncharacterized protein n=1 Tax=Phanerochaete sordida TaxID=48140 RepID=A0A9P3GQG2_9APHY|nr:hypothetical protein PsYK624_158930 [Phanerochaete sordida]
MNRCPVELWQKIFANACTDGGHTARALSLVSRATRDVAEPVRFYTVSLTSEAQVLSFGRLLGTRSITPIIHHLFLSVKMHFEGTDSGRARYMAIYNILINVVTAAAPNVITLMVHATRYGIVDPALAFPRLRDLAIDGFVPVPPALAAPCFPSLRRIHVDGGPNVGSNFWRELGRAAPSLTDIRLSDVTRDFTNLLAVMIPIVIQMPAGVVRHSLLASPTELLHARRCAAAVPALTNVVVVPPFIRSEDPFGYSWNARVNIMTLLRYDCSQQDLEELAAASAQGHGTGRLVMLPEQEDYTREEAYNDWLDVVGGSDGPWRMGDAINNAATV